MSKRRKEVCDRKREERGVAVCQKEERKFVAVNRREISV